MGADVVLAAGRARAQQTFVDTCTIERPGKPVTNPIDGTVTTPMRPLYSGACAFQQASAPWAGPATVGQAGVGLSTQEVKLPIVGSEGITKDDIVTCTSSRNDPELVGKKFAVQGAHHASEKTSRRLPLMEVIG